MNTVAPEMGDPFVLVILPVNVGRAAPWANEMAAVDINAMKIRKTCFIKTKTLNLIRGLQSCFNLFDCLFGKFLDPFIRIG